MAGMTMGSTRNIFGICQHRPNAFAKGIAELVNLYKTSKHEEFLAELLTVLQIIIPDVEKPVCAERLIDLTAQFVVSPDLVTAADENSQRENRLLVQLLTTALDWTRSGRKMIRQRSCELVGRILHHVEDDNVIDDDLFQKVEDAMLIRLTDTVASVRVKSVGALSRLQEPASSQCRITEALLFHLSSDPNPEVRTAILKVIVPSNRTLGAILSRTRDVKENVRKLAYERLIEKVPLKYLTIQQRMSLLHDGLNDRSAAVQKLVSENLLRAWLTQCNESPLALLRMLDTHGSEETMEVILKVLFEMLDTKDVVETFGQYYLNEKRIIPVDRLTCEAALYWKHVAQLLHSRKEADADLYLETIFPELAVYSDYVCEYVLSPGNEWDTLKKLESCFISQQLIALAQVADISDNTGRAVLESCVRRLLLSPKVGSILVPQLMKLICLLYPEEDQMLQEVMSIMSEIQTLQIPVLPAANQEQSITQPWDIQVARMRVELDILRGGLADAVHAEDFAKAMEIKEKIGDVEQSLLEKQQQTSSELLEADDMECLTDKNVRTVLKCLTIIAEMLANMNLKSLPSSLQTCIYEIILPRVSVEDAVVRKQATRALVLCCILSKQVAIEQMRLLMEVALVDHPPIQVIALGGAFDLVLTYGTEPFMAACENLLEGDDEDKDSSDGSNPDPLIAFFIKFLSSVDGEVQTVAAEGLAMLQLYGHVYSPILLSYLILLWYNPTTDSNSQFSQTLGAFMATYSSSGSNAVRCFEEAFLPTLKTLFTAPPSSPLSQVDPFEVVTFLVDVTLQQQPEHKSCVTKLTEQTPHDRLAEELCNEVLKNPFASDVTVLLKALSTLQITENASFKELSTAARQMEKRVRDKRSVALVKKFRSKVRLTSQEGTAEEEDSTSMEIESVTTSSIESAAQSRLRPAAKAVPLGKPLNSQDPVTLPEL